MARYTGPMTRKSRRLGVDLVGGDAAFEKRPYAPGQHGRGRIKESEYLLQLREKQKAKRYYGLLESQFRGYFEIADRRPGQTGENLLSICESRLDNVVYRLGFAMSRPEARQLVNHGHFTVNGKRVDIPSYLVSVGDVIEVCERSRSSVMFKRLLGEDAVIIIPPQWLEREKNTLKGTVTRLPAREDIDFPVEEHLIVELYSK